MSLAARIEQARKPQLAAAPSTAAGATAAPRRDPFAAVKASVHQGLLDSLGPKLYDPRLEQSELDQQVRQTLQAVLEEEEAALSASDRARVAQEVADEILGHGPLEPLLRDPDVTEIMVNGPRRIFVERSGRLHEVDAQFTSETHLRRTIDKIVGRVGRRVDEASPMVDARLLDGSRVNAVIPPLAVHGSSLTIRKFSDTPYQVADLVTFGTMTPGIAELLHACVQARLNILV